MLKRIFIALSISLISVQSFIFLLLNPALPVFAQEETQANIESTVSATSSDTSTPTPTSQPESLTTPASTPSESPNPTPTEEVLGAVVLQDTSASSLQLKLGVNNEITLTSLTSDKVDYAPTDTALIYGSNLAPSTTYTLLISSTDEPLVNFQTSITTDNSGEFIYAYQLDGIYRPNYSMLLKDQSENTVATTTFTDTVVQTGHIIIVKDAIPNNAQDFTFNDNFNNGNPATFQLDDDSTVALPNTRNFEVLPGTFSVSEDAISGWKQSSATCSDGSPVNNINVSAGETVTCTFTNKKLGSIVLIKNTVGSNGTFDFVMTSTSLPSSAQLATSGGTATQTFNNIDPENTYSINETVPADWDLTNTSCVNENSVSKDHNSFKINNGG